MSGSRMKSIVAVLWAAILLVCGSAFADYEDYILKEHVESDLYPIRVYYDELAMASDALGEAEAGWEEQVLEMGFELPTTIRSDVIEVGFDFYIGSDTHPQALATFEILGDDPSTTRTDCPTFGVINSDVMYSINWTGMAVRHILNHASLHSVDCIEPQMPSYDFFTDAVVEISMGESDPMWRSYFLSTFQSFPHYCLDFWGTSPETVYYQFGSALFVLFLDEYYGSADGALIPALWDGTRQDGILTSWSGEFASADGVENEPDFLDSISSHLDSMGVSFDEAFARFVEYRFFIGEDDDGAHLMNASTWEDCEVSMAAVHFAMDMPLTDVPSPHGVGEYGSAFVELRTSGADENIEVEFSGNPETRWSASLLLTRDGSPADVLELPLVDDHEGSIIVESPGEYLSIVLAVGNLGDGDRDPDTDDCTLDGGDFVYSFTTYSPPEPEPEPDEDLLEEEVEMVPDAYDDDGTTSTRGSGCACSFIY